MKADSTTVLFCIAFAGIGFSIGRVTAPCGHQGCSTDRPISLENIEVITAELEAFEGDTSFSIPGGEVVVVQNGDELDVSVEVDAETERPRVIRKQVVIEREN